MYVRFMLANPMQKWQLTGGLCLGIEGHTNGKFRRKPSSVVAGGNGRLWVESCRS